MVVAPCSAKPAQSASGDSAAPAASAASDSQSAPILVSAVCRSPSIWASVSAIVFQAASTGIETETPGPELIILYSSGWAYPW